MNVDAAGKNGREIGREKIVLIFVGLCCSGLLHFQPRCSSSSDAAANIWNGDTHLSRLSLKQKKKKSGIMIFGGAGPLNSGKVGKFN